MSGFTLPFKIILQPYLQKIETKNQKAKILHAYIWLFVICGIAFSLFYYFAGLILSFYALLFSCGIFMVSVFFVKGNRDTQPVSQIILFCLFSLITVLVIDSGGSQSVVIPIYITLPILAILFQLPKTALFYTALVMIIVSYFFTLDLRGAQFQNHINSDYDLIYGYVFRTFTFLFATGLLAIYHKQITESYNSIKLLNHRLEGKNAKMEEMADQAINFSKYLTEVEDELTKTLAEERETRKELEEAQTKLVQSEKMASLGQLTAGIAHEINNPVNFIQNGVEGLKENLEDLLKYNKIEEKCWKAVEDLLEEGQIKDEDNQLSRIIQGLKDSKTRISYDEVISEFSELTQSIQNGAHRTSEIVEGLRTFSRLDENSWKTVNIAQNIDSTLVLLKNQYKNHIEIAKNYGSVPDVETIPGKLNQIFMNILNNAIQAIEGEGKITISTKTMDNESNVRVTISDTGKGIPKEIKNKIYDPFFTTKDVGSGTGLGLAISKGIAKDLNTYLLFDSEEGIGTSFYIILPVIQPIKKR